MGHLRGLAGGADRFVVVDTETTGVYPSDRVCEIAIITVDLDGRVIDEYDTLINPLRDLSATHIHGITGEMIVGAPTFAEVAGDIALRLDGACFVAHNVPFDRRMLVNEFNRLGLHLTITASVDTLVETGSRLTVACAQFDIDLSGAHRALIDARATAELLLELRQATPGGPLAAPASLPRSGLVRRREDAGRVAVPEPPLVAFLASRLNLEGLEVASLAYLDLLGRAIADVHLDREERAVLAEFANELGLSAAHVQQAHRRYLHELIDAAVDDGEVTDEEYDLLVRAASALDIDQGEVEARVHKMRVGESFTVLTEGMRVVFTGDHHTLTREELQLAAAALGLVPVNGVSKSTSFVCAADPDTNSGKAAKARQYGIPVISMEEFLAAQLGSILAGSGADLPGLKVITCPDCLVTWTVAAITTRKAVQRCKECAAIVAAKPHVTRKAVTSGDRPSVNVALIEGTPVPTAAVSSGFDRNAAAVGWGPPVIEWLSCRGCLTTWHRQRVRGRKPHYCPACSGEVQLPPPAHSST